MSWQYSNMSAGSEDFACTVGARPLGNFDRNRRLDNCVRGEKSNITRKTRGKENETQDKAARARQARAAPLRRITPKKSALRKNVANRAQSSRITEAKTPVPPKGKHRKPHSANHHVAALPSTAGLSKTDKEKQGKDAYSSDKASGTGGPGEEYGSEPPVMARIPHLGKPGGMIRTGPVRVKTPNRNAAKHTPKMSKRIGIDGTSRTPSKELLRSTACSRGHQIAQLGVDESDTVDVGAPSIAAEGIDDSIDLSFDAMELNVNINNRSEVSRRDFLENPVALTLLNGGKENCQYLLRMDREPASVELPPFASPARYGDGVQVESPTHFSNTLNEEEVSSMARPKALAASRHISFEA